MWWDLKKHITHSCRFRILTFQCKPQHFAPLWANIWNLAEQFSWSNKSFMFETSVITHSWPACPLSLYVQFLDGKKRNSQKNLLFLFQSVYNKPGHAALNISSTEQTFDYNLTPDVSFYHGNSFPRWSLNPPWSLSVRLERTVSSPETLSSTVKSARGPPMSVLTQPGCRDIQRIPSDPRSAARHLVTMFNAALEMR